MFHSGYFSLFSLYKALLDFHALLFLGHFLFPVFFRSLTNLRIQVILVPLFSTQSYSAQLRLADRVPCSNHYFILQATVTSSLYPLIYFTVCRFQNVYSVTDSF